MKNLWIAGLLLVTMTECKKSGGDGGGAGADPSISFEDLSMPEGTGSSSTFNLVVKLSKASSKQVTVNYTSVDGSARASDDYTGFTNKTLTFQANETEKTIAISVVADDLKEADEEFGISFTSPSNASLARAAAYITIRNDDTKVPYSNTGYTAPTTYPGYTLAWSDEFNGTSLNTSDWTVEGGDGCPNVCGWGNNELEFYTGRSENLFFQDGKMIVEARKEAYNGKNYTSSKIVSRGKKTFKFGRIDIRAILPKGKGIWPAFWLLPQSNLFGGWPTSGEIDMMEMVGHEANKTYGTVHYGPGPGSTQVSRSTTLSSGVFNDEFHVFSLEWKQDQIKWFLDGNLFSTVNKTDLTAGVYPFNEDFFFIINLAVGGNWPGNPDGNTTFPQWLIVDYVRLYQ